MFKKIKDVAKKFFGSIADGVGGMRAWITLSGRELREEERNGFAYAAIRAIINACCNGEIQLRNSGGSVIPYEKKGKNPLLDLLYRPMPGINENLFKQIVVAQFLAYGNVFILKDARDSQGRPTRLIPIPQPCIEPVLDSYGFPYEYKINTTAGSYTARKEDIIHIYEGNELSLFWGQSRMRRAQIDSDIMNSAKVFNLAFFRNGANPGGVISFPEGIRLDSQKASEVLAQFNDQHEGSAKAHRTAILSQGGKYESFKNSHKDMEYGEGLEYHQQQILSIAGVPPALVGLFKFAPQFNTIEQQKMFYETNITPIMRLFADSFSEDLVPEFFKDESVYVWYDFGKVKALEPDWNSLADACLKLSQKFPINEVKDVLGLPFNDIEGGDEPPSPILSAFGLNAPKTDTKSVKKVRYLTPTIAQIKKHKQDINALIDEQGKVMEKSIERHFAFQADLVKNYLTDLDKTFNYDDCFGSIKEQRDLLLAVKVPALAEIFSAGIEFEQAYLQSLKPSKDFKFAGKKDMQSRVQQWAQIHAFKWADSIEHTTLERIDRIIKLGLEQGMPNRDINNIILQFFSEEGYEPSKLTPNDNGAKISILDRVKTIVQTETRSTISEAQLEAFKSTPFVNGKVWITTLGITDHHEGHAEMDGQVVGINEEFVNPITQQTAQAPGQFGTADQDINCLCTLAPRVIDED